MEYEDLLLSIGQTVKDLVVSFDSVQVFGFGLWTWLLFSTFVVFMGVFVILPIIVGWFE